MVDIATLSLLCFKKGLKIRINQFRLVVGLQPLEEMTISLEFEQLLQLR
jgi:hypothetical protein